MKKLIYIIMMTTTIIASTSARSLIAPNTPISGVYKLYSKKPVVGPDNCLKFLELTVADGGVLGSIAKIEEKIDPRSMCAFIALYDPFVRVFSIAKDFDRSDVKCGGSIYKGSGIEDWKNNITITDYRYSNCDEQPAHAMEVEINLDGETLNYFSNPQW